MRRLAGGETASLRDPAVALRTVEPKDDRYLGVRAPWDCPTPWLPLVQIGGLDGHQQDRVDRSHVEPDNRL